MEFLISLLHLSKVGDINMPTLQMGNSRFRELSCSLMVTPRQKDRSPSETTS